MSENFCKGESQKFKKMSVPSTQMSENDTKKFKKMSELTCPKYKLSFNDKMSEMIPRK